MKPESIVVGIAWQTSLVLIPVCLVIRKFDAMLLALGTGLFGLFGVIRRKK